MPKYAIITPTYISHFKYIPHYLDSFSSHVIDKENFTIYFIISKSEDESFNKILKVYTKLNIVVLYVEDLFEKYGIDEKPEDFLEKYGRFTFQTAKKFLGILEAKEEKSLILDSESMFIKKAFYKELFDNFFKYRVIHVSKSKLEDFGIEFTKQMRKNIEYILSYQSNFYPFENYMWFYEKHIIKEMFDRYGAFGEIVSRLYKHNKDLQKPILEKYGIFEIHLYLNYINKYNSSYSYTFIDVQTLFEKYFDNDSIKAYLDKYKSSPLYGVGLLEHCLTLMDKKNYRGFAKLFKENNFNIIRCDYSDLTNYRIQKEFMGYVKPYILACSQEHAFDPALGVGGRLIKLVKYTRKNTMRF